MEMPVLSSTVLSKQKNTFHKSIKKYVKFQLQKQQRYCMKNRMQKYFGANLI